MFDTEQAPLPKAQMTQCRQDLMRLDSDMKSTFKPWINLVIACC